MGRVGKFCVSGVGVGGRRAGVRWARGCGSRADIITGMSFKTNTASSWVTPRPPVDPPRPLLGGEGRGVAWRWAESG